MKTGDRRALERLRHLWRSDTARVRSALQRRWRRSPTPLRIAFVVAATAAAAYWAASQVTPDATFAVGARTEVVTLDVDCDRPLAWQLPAGSVGPPGERAAAGAGVVSAELRGGARARIWLDAAQHWRVAFDAVNPLGCPGVSPEVGDIVVVSAGARRLPPSADGYAYRSAEPFGRGNERPLLPLRGRIVVGDEVVFGAGFAGGIPLLLEARIEARTPDPLTLQRRLIHEERVDAGGIVDSHGCLDDTGAALQRCLAAARPAEGFVHAAEVGDRLGFDVQMLVTGRHVGVRQHGGTQRRILVTRWSQWASSAWLQLSAAGLLFVSALAQIWSVMHRRGSGLGG